MNKKLFPKNPEEWLTLVRLECLCNIKDRKAFYARSIDISNMLDCKTSLVNYHLGKLVKKGKLTKVPSRWWTEYTLVTW